MTACRWLIQHLFYILISWQSIPDFHFERHGSYPTANRTPSWEGRDAVALREKTSKHCWYFGMPQRQAGSSQCELAELAQCDLSQASQAHFDASSSLFAAPLMHVTNQRNICEFAVLHAGLQCIKIRTKQIWHNPSGDNCHQFIVSSFCRFLAWFLPFFFTVPAKVVFAVAKKTTLVCS